MVDYWLPEWWGWIDNWDTCSTCLAYNGSPCTSCEIPPGMLALACLVGGGTATVAGNLRGNATIASAQQAHAAAVQHGAAAVANQAQRKQSSVTIDGDRDLDLSNASVTIENNLNLQNR
jgi:hypothetical protein